MKINLARYTSPFSNPWVVISETLMLPMLAIALGIWINPLDPLWTGGSFPWLWLAPVLLSLRYGPFPGIAGAVVLFLAWLAFNAAGWVGGEFPKLYFLGGLLLVMISGEFSSLWVARARRAETTQAYLDQRLEYLTHQYYLLRLSHDRLEQDLISRPMSMREALTTLRQLSLESGGPLPGAEALLRLFAQYCQIEVGAVYASTPISRNAPEHGFERQAAAVLGQPTALDMDDPLVRRAMEGNSMWHVQSLTGDDASGTNPMESLPDELAHTPGKTTKGGRKVQKKGGRAAHESRYLIVAPLTTFDGQRVGLLTVERLPFFALHGETLQTLDLLLGYYTDGLAIRRLAEPVCSVWADCPAEFASELTRLSRVARDSQVDSLIVALEFVEPEAATSVLTDSAHPASAPQPIGDMPIEIQRQKRMLDVSWLIRPDGDQRRTVLLTLMPLAGNAAAEGYIARVEKWVRQQRQLPLLDAGVFTHQWTVDGTSPADQLSSLLALCHVGSQTRPAADSRPAA